MGTPSVLLIVKTAFLLNRFREYFNSILFCVPRYLHRVTTGSIKRSASATAAAAARHPRHMGTGGGTGAGLKIKQTNVIK